MFFVSLCLFLNSWLSRCVAFVCRIVPFTEMAFFESLFLNSTTCSTWFFILRMTLQVHELVWKNYNDEKIIQHLLHNDWQEWERRLIHDIYEAQWKNKEHCSKVDNFLDTFPHFNKSNKCRSLQKLKVCRTNEKRKIPFEISSWNRINNHWFKV